MPQQPKPAPEWSWERCEKLVSDPSLFKVLKTRLVYLAMNTESAVATRSIEMIHELGAEKSDDYLGDLPSHLLQQARAKARELLLKGVSEADNGL